MKARLFVILVVLGLCWPANWSAIAQSPMPPEKGSMQDAARPKQGDFDPFAGPMFEKGTPHPDETPTLPFVATKTAVAADNEFPPADDLSRAWVRTSDGAFVMPDGKIVSPTPTPPAVEAAAPAAAGGPDDFGYTWDDSVPFRWIDATVGSDTGLSQGPRGASVTAPIDLGFPFKFYENTYTNITISTAGAVGFTGSNLSGSTSTPYVPTPATPNNFIAPYLAPLWVNSGAYTGRVYYLRGGAAPNRYMVVEWFQAQDNIDGRFTFEVILYENGNIEFSYQSMAHGQGYHCSTVTAIEDASGYDGLAYRQSGCNYMNKVSGKTVRFQRPDTGARVGVYPPYQGRFTRAGEVVAFQTAIRNTGELGADTFDLALSSFWPAALYAADGLTPLADTDGDSVLDTGPVPQGGAATVVAKVTTPAGAQVGAHNIATVTARSSLNTAKTKTVQLQTAVPAPFAQVYRDDADGAMTLYLAQPAGQAARKASANSYYGYDQAVAETPSGNFVYAWRRGRSVASAYVYEIEYTLLDRYGTVVRPISRLTDHSSATVYTYDNLPALAVTPDGRIGVLWYRYLYNNSTSQYNYNIYFAVLDPSGSVVVPPTNLTNNNAWGGWNDLNVPRFYNPRITATGDNRFVLAWDRDHRESGGYVTDVYYAVRSNGGGEVHGVSKLTADTPGYDESYSYPGITALSGNRTLLCYTRGSDDDIYCAVLDSAGNVTRPPANVSGDGGSSWDWLSDAVQLADGRIVVAWTGGNYPNYDIRFAVLDAAFNRIAGPTALTHPAAVVGNGYVSVTADAKTRAILTWMDYHYGYRPNLYYTLVDNTGTVLTPPTIFRTSQGASPRIESSYAGYGNTSYSSTPPSGVDGVAAFASSLFAGPPGGNTAVGLRYANYGAAMATSVMLTATLSDSLTYAGDTSGITPTVSGNTVVWNLPDLGCLADGRFTLYVGVPAGAGFGTRYPITLALTSTGPEANPGNNTATAQVMVARQIYLPLVMRN